MALSSDALRDGSLNLGEGDRLGTVSDNERVFERCLVGVFVGVLEAARAIASDSNDELVSLPGLCRIFDVAASCSLHILSNPAPRPVVLLSMVNQAQELAFLEFTKTRWA